MDVIDIVAHIATVLAVFMSSFYIGMTVQKMNDIDRTTKIATDPSMDIPEGKDKYSYKSGALHVADEFVKEVM